MAKTSVEMGVEAICNKGCQSVRRDIQLMEQGEQLAELMHLSEEQRQRVLAELKTVMSVYGDSCRIS